MSTILVVDDEEDVRVMLKTALNRNGCQVSTAASGREALALYKNEGFDLVITDLVMPDVSGIDLIMELRNLNSGVNIIAISGGGGITGRFEYLPIAKLIGANYIFSKPFSLAEMRKAVDSMLLEAS